MKQKLILLSERRVAALVPCCPSVVRRALAEKFVDPVAYLERGPQKLVPLYSPEMALLVAQFAAGSPNRRRADPAIPFTL